MLGFEPSGQGCLLTVTAPGSWETWEANQETAESLGISHPAVHSLASSSHTAAAPAAQTFTLCGVWGQGREDEGKQVYLLLVNFCNSHTNYSVIL